MYLQEWFNDWHVDCEYNRNGYTVKTLQGDLVRPDIAVHKRGRIGAEHNLLVIEGKPSNRVGSKDELRDRLELFKKEIGFQHAVLLVFDFRDKTINREFV